MKKDLPTLTLLLLLAPTSLFAQQQQSSQPTPLAFTHVTIIDVAVRDSTRALKPNQTVVVTGDRITDVGGTVRIPDGTQVIDASGKYLIPGLWDMHTHQAWRFRALYLANGITGFRDMGGPPLERLADIRKRIAEGNVLAPRLVASGGMLDGPSPAWPTMAIAVADAGTARQAVDSLKRGGVDFVKVYSLLPRDAYFAAIDEAKKQGLPVAGHVPEAMQVAEASNAGQRSIEHMPKLQLAASTLEDTVVAAYLANPREARTRQASDYSQMKSVVDTYDEKRATELFRLFARNGTWVTPTLVNVQNRSTHAGDDDYSKDPRFKYMPAAAAEAFWSSRGNAVTAEQLAILKSEFQAFLRTVGAMHRAGVRLLAGSDAPARRFTFPGFSLHGELELLVSAGLTPREALQTATLNPARFLGLEKDLGTIERGKLADLVLLNADPLTDIRNTQRIEAVILDGRLLDRAALDNLLAQAETAAKR